MFHSRLQVHCDPAYAEILMAEIAEAGFDTFLETDKGFEAYVELENFDRQQLQHIKEKYSSQTPLTFLRTVSRNKIGMNNGKKIMSPLSLTTDV